MEELIPTMNAIADMNDEQLLIFHDTLVGIDDTIKYNPGSSVGVWFKGLLGITQYTKLTDFYKTLFGDIYSDRTKYKEELQDFIKLIFNDKKYSNLYSVLYSKLQEHNLFPLPSPLATETYKNEEYKCTISELQYIDCKNYYLNAALKRSGRGGSRKKNKSRTSKKGRKTSKSNKRNRV